MKILYSPRFKKSYKKLDRRVQVLAEARMEIFRNDPFDSRLKTHKLHGVFAGYYAFSINYSQRVILSFEGEETVHLHTIGGHEVYG